MKRVLVFVLVLVAGCSGPAVVPEPQPAATFAPLPRDSLSVEAAREAHRRAELRRHLRYLEAIEPGALLRATAAAVPEEKIDAGRVSLAELYEVGRLLFEHEYSFTDGLGSGRRARDGRPFRRVHEGRFGGPETTGCTSCHWRGGPAGAGALQDNSFLYGDNDSIESADARNPPPLQGVGLVEALAREMSVDLQAIRTRLVREARRQGTNVESELVSKGVRFGVLRVAADGTVNTSGVEGVDPDLVIKPFGWKGTFATLRDFVAESLQVHFGIQSEELVRAHRVQPDPDLLGRGTDPLDPDGDGVTQELTAGQLTALVSFLALGEVPVIRPPETLHDFEPAAKHLIAPTATVFLDEWARGRHLFDDIGCASCHVPMLVLKDPVFRTGSGTAAGGLEFDLSRQGETPRVRYDPRLQGYPLWLFSDMKRHDLGGKNTSRHVDHGVTRPYYLTRRLWGLANSPPYFHDGHAPWFDHAIDAHGGEAAEARKAFHSLSREGKGALRQYLLSLTRQRRLVVP